MTDNILTTDPSPTLRRIARCLVGVAPLVFASIALMLGKDAGWDLLNYHWYVPYALLQQRLGFDIAVAHHATYHNPIIDVPFYWLAIHAPAWLAGAFLGALYGVVVALLGMLAYQILAGVHPVWRLSLSVLLALAGAFGAGALPSIGNPANDAVVAMGLLLALWLLLRHWSRWQTSASYLVLCAGLCAGASVGLKLTTAVYAVGLWTAVVVCGANGRSRWVNTLWFASGMLLGIAIFGGYWLWQLWQYSGNPLFPYFNELLPSPLLNAGDYGDKTFPMPQGLMAWLFPLYFTRDSLLVAEWSFRDAHIAVCYLVLPVTLVWCGYRVLTARQIALTASLRQMLFLSVFAAVTYVLWLCLFRVYRYLIPLEMLAPVLLLAALLQWPGTLNQQAWTLAVTLLALQSWMRVDIQRQPWDAHYVEVSVPKLPDAEHSMVLLTGESPMSFVIPAFAPDIAFLRIDGHLVWKEDRQSGLAREMHRRVAQHAGPLYVLFTPWERQRALESLAEYQLELSGACYAVPSNLTDPLSLCRVQLRAS